MLGLAVPAGSRLPDNRVHGAGGLIGAAGGALQAASRTLVVHQAEGRVAPAQAFGLFALSGRATAFIGPAAIAGRHRGDRLAAGSASARSSCFSSPGSRCYTGSKPTTSSPGSPRMIRRTLATCLALAVLATPPTPQTAAALFAAKGTPSPHPPYAIGQSSKGCLAGAVQLPETGPTWQAMRLSPQPQLGPPGRRSASSRT